MSFYWWDDALTIARRRALNTGKRQHVYRAGGLWYVSEAWRQVTS
jgi:hypothetical protein